MAIYSIRFTVTGLGYFPLDMLRYDGCYPAGQDDVLHLVPDRHSRTALTATPAPSVSIELIHIGDQRAWHPTEARWRSFGWRVVPGRTTTHKL